MPLSDNQTLILAVPIAAALYWWRPLVQAIRRSRSDDILPPNEPIPTDPLAFERYCAAQLRAAGWQAETTVASGDQGVDVLAKKGRITVAIQCKLYSGPVGNDAVQQVIAGRDFRNARYAAVVSNQSYTRSAHDLAVRTGVMLLHPHDLARADRLFR